ncbi:MAG TPA: AI-2E family transporter, partial [Pyrinomonadaceae bacterium]|nr:AI-2E family transporter [Pyrinomonadaceae bacterium]
YIIGSVTPIPILASFALAYLLDPLVSQFEKRGLSRLWSAITGILLVILMVTAFLAYVLPDLWAESSKAAVKIAQNFTPENAARQRAMLRRYSPALEKVAGDKIEKFLSEPMNFYNENIATETTVDENGKVHLGGGSAILQTVSSSLDIFLIPFFVFYILIDFPKWRDSLEGLIPPRFRDPFTLLFNESGRILESFIRGQITIGMLMAVLYAIGFWLLGVPAWAGIALIAGLLNSIPYVGTVLGIILACGFTFSDGGGIGNTLAVLGIFAVVQTIEGYILTPRIIGARLNLHPMAVFLGLLIGGKLFGLLGIVLAIPALAIGKVFLKFFRELYQASYFYHDGEVHPMEVPSEKIEDRLVEAAETVLAEQVQKDNKDKGE